MDFSFSKKQLDLHNKAIKFAKENLNQDLIESDKNKPVLMFGGIKSSQNEDTKNSILAITLNNIIFAVTEFDKSNNFWGVVIPQNLLQTNNNVFEIFIVRKQGSKFVLLPTRVAGFL